MRNQLEVLPANKNFVASGRDRLLQAEELRLRGEVERSLPAFPQNPNFIGSVSDQLRIDVKTAGSFHHLSGSDLLSSDGRTINQQLKVKVCLQFTALAEIVIESEKSDGCVARVAPLCATAVLDKPVR